ncbi:MAG: hypothetical protein ACREBP_10950, partial [Sphingomicrobium sp.]
TYDDSLVSSMVSVRDGTATIGDFSFTTTGDLILDASLGSMTAGTINLAAGTFVPYTFDPPQAGPGTYFADSFTIATGGDFITNANLVSTDTLDIFAPGLIDMRNATSMAGNLSLDAGSAIDAGILDAAGFVSVFAQENITLGNVDSGDFIDVFSEGGAIAVGNLIALNQIDLDAFGPITFGNVSADDFNFVSGGAVSGGNIVATTHADGEAEGAIVVGDVTVSGPPSEGDFSVGFASATSIQTGNVDGFANVGFATLGNLTTGNLSAGNLVMTLASGDIVTGSITTTQENGQVYMADGSMFTDAGGPDDFILSEVLNAPPVPTGGSITIGGPVST